MILRYWQPTYCGTRPYDGGSYWWGVLMSPHGDYEWKGRYSTIIHHWHLLPWWVLVIQFERRKKVYW